MIRKISLPFALLFGMFFISGKLPHKKEEIESAMNRYNHYLVSMNVDSIASLFCKDGDLGNIAHGQDSIKRFLLKFKNYKVLSQSTKTISISIKLDTAFHKGMYDQTTITPHQDTVRVKGQFNARWIWSKALGWKIKRMDTTPMN